VNIIVNGEPQDVPDNTSVAQLLVGLELASRPVAVEVNQQLVSRPEHAERVLRAGDRLEIVTLVGGG
jgi:sulfur carrier protein